MKKISIAVPVYNSEKYIERCLESIKLQTYRNIEIIIIDDGSTDNSGKICDRYAQEDERFRVFHQRNQGVSVARNNGLDKATGEYILFIDSDDWINNNTIELLVNAINNQETDFVMCQMVNSRKNAKSMSIKKRKDFIKTLKKIVVNEKINPPFCKLYNTNLIKKNNIKFKEDIPIAEDLLFNITYCSKINSFEIIEDKCYNYNCDNTLSLSRRYNKEKYRQLMIVNNEIAKIMSSFNDKSLVRVVDYIKIKNIFSCIIDLNRKQCELSYQEKKAKIKKMQNDNKIGIIFNCGVKPFMYSCVYNIVRNPKLLMALAGYIK
ncbi:MAG: glycosyltransferase family 2 protein [Clostridia bacterium]|nr:glycosyltransferase family 2 protein [Clostridia bacterium]